jgi:uncharacterized protein
MVESRSQINEIIFRYRKELVQNGIKVFAIYLYGSYVHGSAHEGSDIDLVVVSPDFGNMNIRERLELLGLASARILEPIQAYGFTPQEIGKHKLNSFWSNILEHEAQLV